MSMKRILTLNQNEDYSEGNFYKYMHSVREIQAANNAKFLACSGSHVFNQQEIQWNAPVMSKNEERSFKRNVASSDIRSQLAVFNFNELEKIHSHEAKQTVSEFDQKLMTKYGIGAKSFVDAQKKLKDSDKDSLDTSMDIQQNQLQFTTLAANREALNFSLLYLRDTAFQKWEDMYGGLENPPYLKGVITQLSPQDLMTYIDEPEKVEEQLMLKILKQSVNTYTDCDEPQTTVSRTINEDATDYDLKSMQRAPPTARFHNQLRRQMALERTRSSRGDLKFLLRTYASAKEDTERDIIRSEIASVAERYTQDIVAENIQNGTEQDLDKIGANAANLAKSSAAIQAGITRPSVNPHSVTPRGTPLGSPSSSADYWSLFSTTPTSSSSSSVAGLYGGPATTTAKTPTSARPYKMPMASPLTGWPWPSPTSVLGSTRSLPSTPTSSSSSFSAINTYASQLATARDVRRGGPQEEKQKEREYSITSVFNVPQMRIRHSNTPQQLQLSPLPPMGAPSQTPAFYSAPIASSLPSPPGPPLIPPSGPPSGPQLPQPPQPPPPPPPQPQPPPQGPQPPMQIKPVVGAPDVLRPDIQKGPLDVPVRNPTADPIRPSPALQPQSPYTKMYLIEKGGQPSKFFLTMQNIETLSVDVYRNIDISATVKQLTLSQLQAVKQDYRNLSRTQRESREKGKRYGELIVATNVRIKFFQPQTPAPQPSPTQRPEASKGLGVRQRTKVVDNPDYKPLGNYFVKLDALKSGCLRPFNRLGNSIFCARKIPISPCTSDLIAKVVEGSKPDIASFERLPENEKKIVKKLFSKCGLVEGQGATAQKTVNANRSAERMKLLRAMRKNGNNSKGVSKELYGDKMDTS